MSDQVPTGELRFIERWIDGKDVRILQQRWREEAAGGHWLEWRDVPYTFEHPTTEFVVSQ